MSIIKACEKSLKRLKTDYIDLYQLHRPSSIVPIEETLDVLTDLIKQGKIRYIGCSTHPAWKVAESIRISEKNHFSKIATEQSPYNLLDRRIENELMPMCEYYGLGLITWAPLAMGVLAGRYKKNEQNPKNSRAILRGGFYADRVNERGIDAGVAARDAHALEHLNPLAGAFDHLDMDPDRVAGGELGSLFAGGQPGDLLALELFDDVHGPIPSLFRCAFRGGPTNRGAARGLSPRRPRAATPVSSRDAR